MYSLPAEPAAPMHLNNNIAHKEVTHARQGESSSCATIVIEQQQIMLYLVLFQPHTVSPLAPPKPQHAVFWEVKKQENEVATPGTWKTQHLTLTRLTQTLFQSPGSSSLLHLEGDGVAL